MFSIFETFLSDLLTDAWDTILDPLQGLITQLLVFSLKAEEIGSVWDVDNPITQAVIDNVYTFTYAAMCGVMVLAFLYKGFKVYILWRDGDAEVSPQTMILGCVWAIIMALAFPYLYDILVDVVVYLGNGITDRFQLGLTPSADIFNLLSNSRMLVAIFLLLFFILMLVIFCKLLSRGVELMFMRLGFPLICLDLINSDASTFKQYTGLFFRQAALSVIQMTCLLLGLYTIANPELVNVILAVVFEMCAMSAPKIMSQLLPPSGGGGGGSRAISAAYMLRMLLTKGA